MGSMQWHNAAALLFNSKIPLFTTLILVLKPPDAATTALYIIFDQNAKQGQGRENSRVRILHREIEMPSNICAVC